MLRFLLYFCVVLTLAANASHCSAASYQFVNIADDAGPLELSFNLAINNSGTVAFIANRDAGGQGIFIGSGGPVTALYDSSGPFNGFSGNPDINDSGTVAFGAGLDAGGGGLFTGNGGPTMTITSNSSRGLINNHGAVAFNTEQGVFVNNGGAVTTIADESGPLYGLDDKSINDSGTVGFSAFVDGVGDGIFTGSGGPITTVALAGYPNYFNGVRGLQINNTGTVAFSAHVFPSDYFIFVGTPGSLTTVADSSGPFVHVGGENALGLNNNGQVAFIGRLATGVDGIFTGPDPLADKVIQIGDPLFGSTITSFLFANALNDNGEIAFHYNLANGISGIAVAKPVPEPCGFVLATLGVCVVALAQRRGRQRQEKTKGGVNNIRSIG